MVNNSNTSAHETQTGRNGCPLFPPQHWSSNPNREAGDPRTPPPSLPTLAL